MIRVSLSILKGAIAARALLFLAAAAAWLALDRVTAVRVIIYGCACAHLRREQLPRSPHASERVGRCPGSTCIPGHSVHNFRSHVGVLAIRGRIRQTATGRPHRGGWLGLLRTVSAALRRRRTA